MQTKSKIQPPHTTYKLHINEIQKQVMHTKFISTFLFYLRGRPFNLKGEGGVMVSCFVQKIFFRTTQELEYLFFWSCKARNFFPEFNIRLYDKNSESDYFFSLHQNQNIFFSNIGNHNIFLEKNQTPPLQVKWLFP